MSNKFEKRVKKILNYYVLRKFWRIHEENFLEILENVERKLKI